MQPPYKLTNNYGLYDDSGRPVAKVEREPDALLFAAAPALLAALEFITDCAAAGPDGVNMDLFIEQARAAIAKARGEA
jgi:hypothetical protein